MNNRIDLGKIGEMVVVAIVKSIFKASEGFRVKHTDFRHYNFGHGLDLRVFERNKQLLGIEVKNWKSFNKPYGMDIYESEILDRFKNFTYGMKLLIITTLSLLTKRAVNNLRRNNIFVVETNKLLGHKDFKSKVFWQIKTKIERLYAQYKHNLKNRRVVVVNQALDEYVSASSDMKHNTIKQSTMKHDTATKKQLFKAHQNRLVEYILSLAKQARDTENQYEAHGFWLIPVEKE